MKKGCFLERFWLLVGCTTTRGTLQPQPQPQPAPAPVPLQVMPHGELLVIIIVALVAFGLIIPLLKGSKAKGRKARPERKKRKR